MDQQFEHFVARVRQALANPLPGKPAQFAMAHAGRLRELDQIPAPAADARIASVINLLHHSEGMLRTVLIVRSVNPRDRHSGQVSFPGGSVEPDDTSLAHAALREAEEEIGIASAKIELLGRLTDLYIPVSNFWVHPFVGAIREPSPDFRPQPGEVECILTPPLAWFADPARRLVRDVPIGQGVRLKDVPVFELEDQVVWGATAMIMNEFVSAVARNSPGTR